MTSNLVSKVLRADHAVVASEQTLASKAGYDVLRKGGNAFDAAVATSFALAVTFHPAGGLGGDFFGMLYESNKGKIHCLNGSGWSPSGTPSALPGRPRAAIPRFGPHTCMVPGMVGGVWEMHRKLGTLEFADLLSASIRYAEDGFPAGEGLCRSTAAAYSELPESSRVVFAPSGRPPRPGEWLRQERLGLVLSTISQGGAAAFYSGWPGEKIRDFLVASGVGATPQDFKDFHSEWVDPITFDYRGTNVYEVPPNSMGATSLLILKLLSQTKLSDVGPLSKERIENTMEAAMAAYAKRDKMLGDPRFGEIDLHKFMSATIDEGVPTSKINPGDTTAFSIADSEGNLVSGIQSLFNHFGSRVFVPECGLMLNNRGAGFSNSGPNRIEPRKRPLTTLSSMILERDGRSFLSIGTSGGDYRPLQHTLFVTNAVDYSMPIDRNVGHPRFLWGGGRSLLIEEGYQEPRLAKFEVQNLPFPGRTGVCHAVELSGVTKTAVCDIRGDGVPVGF